MPSAISGWTFITTPLACGVPRPRRKWRNCSRSILQASIKGQRSRSHAVQIDNLSFTAPPVGVTSLRELPQLGGIVTKATIKLTGHYYGNLSISPGSGRRIRTLTYGVRVRCATFTQSRCVLTNKDYYTQFSPFVKYKMEIFQKNFPHGKNR